MRILHVSSEYPPQQVFGLGRYVCDLSRELAKQGHSVHVLTNSIGGTDRDVVDQGVSIHRVDFPPSPKPPAPGGPVMAFNLHLAQRAHALGRAGLGNPEVIVSHDWLTALAAHRLSRRWGVPHVWTVHDTVHGKRFGEVREVEDRLAFDIERWASRAARLVLVNSRAVQDEILTIYAGDPARTRLLHCGIDPSRMTATQDPDRIRAFRRVFTEPESLLVTYCGRLDTEKGIDTLVNAFALLRRDVPDARLAIAGRGILHKAIAEHVKRANLQEAVRLCGYLEGEVLRHFYIASDIHVCPSWYEPFGLVVAEAMAAGTCVVASATGGLLDLVSDATVGRTFAPGDAAGLAAVLLELAREPELRRRLGATGREHVRKHFAWTTLASKAADFYGSAVTCVN